MHDDHTRSTLPAVALRADLEESIGRVELDTPPSFLRTREEWCLAIIAALRPMLGELGIAMQGERQLRVSIAPLPPDRLGVCHGSKSSADGRTNIITVSTAQASPEELAHTVLHELLHAFDDCHSGHRGRWRRWADRVGIQHKGHARSPIAQGMIDEALRRVGEPAQHVASVHRRTPRVSQVRFECPRCLVHAFMSAGQVAAGGSLDCGKCKAAMATERKAA